MALSDFYGEETINGLDASLSMVTLEEAETYFKGRVGSENWDCVSELTEDEQGESPSEQEAFLKLQALVDATRRINRLNYKGCKADPAQAHAFPRDDDSEIPNNIKDAVCELANELLGGVDDNLEVENLGVLSQSFSGVKTSHDRSSTPLHIIAGIPSVVAWRNLLPFLKDPRKLRMVRV